MPGFSSGNLHSDSVEQELCHNQSVHLFSWVSVGESVPQV